MAEITEKREEEKKENQTEEIEDQKATVEIPRFIVSKRGFGWIIPTISIILNLSVIGWAAATQWGSRSYATFELEKDTARIEAKVDSLKTEKDNEIRKLDERIHNVDLQVAGILGSVSSTREAIAELEKKIEKLDKRQEEMLQKLLDRIDKR